MINDLYLQIHTIEEIIECVRQASFLEVNTPGKPGNVSLDQNIKNLTIIDFHSAIEAVVEEIRRFFNEWIVNMQEPFSSKKARNTSYSLGHLIFRLSNVMMKAQSKGNVLLGHILLFSPLIFATHELISNPIEKQKHSWNTFWHLVEIILREATVEDGIWLYRAIMEAQPGGLKNPGGEQHEFTYDFTSPNVEQKIIQNKRTFLELFNESASFDSISKEMLSNYLICRNKIASILRINNNKMDVDTQTIQTLFLSILSEIPDSLIYRKTNWDTAYRIQEDAKSIMKLDRNNLSQKQEAIKKLNHKLVQNELNPGTTADLTACVILIGLLFGIKN